jgi:hypothetical protein
MGSRAHSLRRGNVLRRKSISRSRRRRPRVGVYSPGQIPLNDNPLDVNVPYELIAEREYQTTNVNQSNP